MLTPPYGEQHKKIPLARDIKQIYKIFTSTLGLL